MNNRPEPGFLEIGDQLPDWSLEKIFKEEVPKTNDFLGKPLLILFFSLGCPGCLGRALPYANRVVHEKKDQMNVIGIHSFFEGPGYSNEQFQQAKEEFFIRFPFYRDKNNNTTFRDYGAGGTPHWILVDANRKVNYSIFGSDPNNALLRLDLKTEELLTSS